jgi:hypothetical protein
MPELLELTGDAARQASAELPPDEVAALGARDMRLVLALLTIDTMREAAQAAGVSEATAFRRVKDPRFQRALWWARRLYCRAAVAAVAQRGGLGTGTGRPALQVVA